MCFILLCILVLTLAVDYQPSDSNSIIFGQSCALTGNSADLGSELSKGIQMAFDQANENGGVLGGKMLNLSVLDDGYEPYNTNNNTEYFLNSPDIFALIGYVGTPTSLSVSSEVQSANIPFLGALTGATFLRTPFNELFINVRSSYDDEATAMINYLVRKKYRLGISIVYQNDSFGNNTYSSLMRSLDPYNIDIFSSATFSRNSLEDIESAVTKISANPPDAIVLAGTYKPIGKFIAQYQETVKTTIPPIFLVFSFVGTVSIAKELELYNTTLRNTIVMEVVPNIILEEHLPDSPEQKLVEKYMSSLPSHSIPSFHGLEGYLVGRLAVEMVRSTFGEFTRENFLQSVYESNQEYYIEGFKLGSFQTEDEKCNQAIHSIYPVRLINSSYFESVKEANFDWDGCLSEPTISKPVIFLKQSTPTTGDLANIGLDFNSGVKSALFKWNTQRSLEERIIGIVTKDDEYNSTITRWNTLEFLNDTVHPTFGFLGFVGTPTFGAIKDLINQTKIPAIGFFTGSDTLREEGQYNVLNIRVGYPEEIFTLAQYALDMKMTRIGVFYMKGFDSVKEYLVQTLEYAGYEILWSMDYNHKVHDFNFTTEIDELFSSVDEIPEVVMILGTYIHMSKFVYQVIQKLYLSGDFPMFDDDIYFGAWSPLDPLDFIEDLKLIGCNSSECLSRLNLFFSEVVPYYNDMSKPIVQEYQENMLQLGFSDRLASFVSMEGFLNGLFFTKIMEQFSNEEIDSLEREEFIQKIYELQTVDIHGISLGPYIQKTTSQGTHKFCNSGLHEAWICYYDAEADSMDVSPTSKTFPYCSGDTAARNELSTFIRKPIFFGLSNDFKKQQNKTFEFSSAVEHGLSTESTSEIDSNLYIIAKDDEGSSEKQEQNLDWFDRVKKVFAYVGFQPEKVSSSSKKDDNKHMIGLSGSIFGSKDATEDSENILYFRPFMLDEIYYACKYYREELGREAFVIFRADDGDEEHETMKRNFQQYFIHTIAKKTNGEIVEEINHPTIVGNELRRKEGNPVLIIAMDELRDFRDDIFPNIENPEKFTFVFPSKFDRHEYEHLFVEDHVQFHQISFFSRSSLFFNDFVSSSFASDLKYKDHAFYGYIVGKWIGSNYVSSVVNNENGFFEQALDPTYSITFQSGVVIDFQKNCRIGIRKIFLYDQDENLLMQKDLSDQQTTTTNTNNEDTETLDYATQEKRKCTLFDSFQPSDHSDVEIERFYWMFIPPLPILFSGIFVNFFGFSIILFCCCCYCCGVITICLFISAIFREKKRLKRFNKLRDVDLLIKEQELEDNVGVAHLKINSKMFLIKMTEIEFIKILGEGGSNSTVYKAKFRNQLVAFKCFRTHSICSSQRNFDQFQREVNVMSSISHPNVVSFYGACLDPPRVGFVMEFCDKGDLSEFLSRQHEEDNIRYPFREKLRMVSEIASAVDYIHSRSIIHRDLKLENVLITTSHSCKVMDFGLSKIVDEMNRVKTKAIGTSEYIAPEIIRSGNYDEKCDTFSFAIMLFVIFTENYFPYGNDSYMPEMQVAYNPEKRPDIKEVADERSVPMTEKGFLVDLMVKCWDDDPVKRLGFDELSKLLIQRLELFDRGISDVADIKDDLIEEGGTETNTCNYNNNNKTAEENEEKVIDISSVSRLSPKKKKDEGNTDNIVQEKFKYDGRKNAVVWKKSKHKDEKNGEHGEEEEGEFAKKYYLLLDNVKKICSEDGGDLQKFLDGI